MKNVSATSLLRIPFTHFENSLLLRYLIRTPFESIDTPYRVIQTILLINNIESTIIIQSIRKTSWRSSSPVNKTERKVSTRFQILRNAALRCAALHGGERTRPPNPLRGHAVCANIPSSSVARVLYLTPARSRPAALQRAGREGDEEKGERGREVGAW